MNSIPILDNNKKEVPLPSICQNQQHFLDKLWGNLFQNLANKEKKIKELEKNFLFFEGKKKKKTFSIRILFAECVIWRKESPKADLIYQ